MRFFRNAASSLLASSALIPIGLLNAVIVARYLEVADLGLYSITLSLSLVVVTVAQIGWQSSVVHRMRRMGSDPALVLTSGVAMMLLVSAVAVVPCLVFDSWILREFMPGASPPVLYLGLASVPFQLLGLLFGAIARGIDRFDLNNGFRVLRALALLGAIAIVLMAREGALIEALAAFLAVHAVATVAMGVALARTTGILWKIDLPEIRESLRFGIKSQVQVLAGQIHERLDLFMIAYFLGDATEVAFYAIAVRVIDRLKLFPEAVGSSLFPTAAGLADREAARFTGLVSRHSVLWVVASAVALALAAPLVVPFLFGENYAASIPPLQILLVAMALLTVYNILSRYFVAIGRQKVNVVTQLLSIAVNIALNIYLIPRYGILGAAWASLVSYALEAFLITFVFVKESGVGLRDALVIRRQDLAEYRRRLDPIFARLGQPRL